MSHILRQEHSSYADVFRNLNDFLSGYFRRAKLGADDVQELESGLAGLVAKLRGADDSSVASKLQEELKKLHKSVLSKSPEKIGPFVSVLKVLRPLITNAEDIIGWLDVVMSSFVDRTDQTRKSAQDATDFVVDAMTLDTGRNGGQDKHSERCAAQLRKIIQASTRRIDTILLGDTVLSHAAANHGLQTLQGFLLAFGRKQPLHLFQQLEIFIVKPSTRFQALQLLCLWLQQQQAHFDLVVKTSVVPHLIHCLQNDRATAVISLALQAIVMLIPHIPAYIASYLPQLFLVYSRCLQWELFDASSKSDSVQDGIPAADASNGPSVAFTRNPEWQVLTYVPLQSEVPDPDLLTLFTYLYGLYPLNFMGYIRGPRRYLQTAQDPGAEEYYLDDDKIRARSEQFQRVHLLHPALFGHTSEEELAQNRWTTSETPEVIAECFGLRVKEQMPKPAAAMPFYNLDHDVQSESTTQTPAETPSAAMLGVSPSQLATLATGTNSPLSLASGDPNLINPEDVPPLMTTASSNVVPRDHLAISTSSSSQGQASPEALSIQQELQMMRSAYQFERYLKQLHVVTIGQLKRDRIRQVIQEAESDRLHATSRNLKKQLEAAIKFNETLQKEAQTRRTHISKSEEQLMAKIRTLRLNLKDFRELKTKYEQVMQDVLTLRQLLVRSEGREAQLKSDLDLTKQQHDHGQKSVASAEAKPALGLDGSAASSPIGSKVHLTGISADEGERMRREYEVRILTLEESLKVAQQSQADSEQGTTVLQQKLLESHDKRLALEKALASATQQLDGLHIGTSEDHDAGQFESVMSATDQAHHSFPTKLPSTPSITAELKDVTMPLSKSEG